MEEKTIVDARGLPCPQPVLKTKEALEKAEDGETILVLVDNETAKNNVEKFVNFQGYTLVKTEKEGKVFKIEIQKKKTETKKETFSEEESEKAPSKPFYIIATDRIGEEKELGKILMKGFFETMLVHGLLPRGIFFMNRGVFLTTKEEEFIKILKELEEKGVEIYTCGTCLSFFKLEKELKVGKRAGTDLYLDAMFKGNVIFIG